MAHIMLPILLINFSCHEKRKSGAGYTLKVLAEFDHLAHGVHALLCIVIIIRNSSLAVM